MKNNTITTAIAALTLTTALALQAPGQGYFAEWQRQQAQQAQRNHQRELEDQRVQLDQQRRQLEQLQQRQRKTERDCDDGFVPLLPLVPTPAPRPYAPTAQDRTYIDSYLRQIMANPSLSHAAKMRLCDQVLRSVK